MLCVDKARITDYNKVTEKSLPIKLIGGGFCLYRQKKGVWFACFIKKESK